MRKENSQRGIDKLFGLGSKQCSQPVDWITEYGDELKRVDLNQIDLGIEKKAQEILDDYGVKYGQIVKPPIPIEEICVRLFGLRCEVKDLIFPDETQSVEIEDKKFIKLNSIIWGGLFHQQKLIVVNTRYLYNGQDIYQGEKRFTIAHELGHWCLLSSHKAKAGRLETKADKFAAAILVPLCILLPLARERDLFDLTDLERFALSFDVPVEVMETRLKKFDLMGKPSRYQLPLFL